MCLTPHASAPEGVLPVANGKPLDLGFESGTLENWTVEGDAFAVVSGQAASGTGASRQPGRPARIGSAAWRVGTRARGTLSSAPFRVTAPYASFLVVRRRLREHARGAGHSPATTTSSTRSPAPTTHMLRPAVVDLSGYVGRDIFVRVVDDETGAPTAVYLKESPWAHINFDDFRFHESKPVFPNEITPDRDGDAAADGSGAARGPSTRRGRSRHDRAEGFHGQARGGRAGRRPADRLHTRRPRPALGCRRHTPIRCARRKARARTAS